MKLRDGSHLTYCSNIHAGETWKEVRDNIEHHYPAVRDRLESGAPFGVGLRLSSQAADELARPEVMEEFLALLARHRLYVFTINGFPYGPFHGRRVKEDVYLPDWRDPERLRYTNRLADLMASLMPGHLIEEGSISTVPGAYKSALREPGEATLIAEQMLAHVAHLIELRRRTGRVVTLALEPEPCCLLETVEETLAFFRRHLFSPEALGRLADRAGISRVDALDAVRRHLGVCLDLCHAAVEYEDPEACIAALEGAGVRILKVQISSGLRVGRLTPEAGQALRQFIDPVYLHQVIERRGSTLTRYADLPTAFDALGGTEDVSREWRVHFHVPIFLDRMETFESTRFFIESVLERHRRSPVSKHLEVETYTWDVLPAQYRGLPVDDAIARELRWVQARLAP